MIILSTIRNCPVICQDKRIGLVMGIGLCDDAKQVTELIIACGLRGKRIVSCGNIQSVADGFLLVKDTMRYKHAHHPAKCMFAYDADGLLLGYVTDYAIDEHTMQIQAIEVLTGYLPGKYTKRVWIFDYECRNQEKVIVPASFCSELMRLNEEDGICG